MAMRDDVRKLSKGDRVKVQNWPVEEDTANDINGREGTILRFHGGYVVIQLDEPPAWNYLTEGRGIYCEPEELVKL